MIIPFAKSQHRLSSWFWLENTSRQAHNRPVSDLAKSRVFTIAAGTLVAVGGFVLVLWAVAWFMPWFLRYSDSPWFRVGPTLLYLLTTSAAVLIVNLRRRRANSLDTKTSRRHL